MGVPRKLKIELGVLAAYFGLTVAVTYPLILKLGTGIYGRFFDTDLRGSMWSIWWLRYARAHHMDYFTCPLIAAPFGTSFHGMPLFSILYAFGRASLSVMTPEVYMNVYTILFLTLSGYGAWLIARREVGDPYASFTAGVIFAFSPYHLNKLWEFGFIYLGVWLTLYTAALLALRDKPCLARTLLAAAAFSLVLSFNAYYALFGAVLTAALCVAWVVAALQEGRGFSAQGRFLLCVCAVFAGACLINAPSLGSIFSRFLKHSAAPSDADAMFIRPIKYLFTQSARPLSYLLPASTHPVFGAFTRRFFGTWWYGRGPIEQTLYLGWIPLFFAWRGRRQQTSLPPEERRRNNAWLGAAWTAFFFSLPPYLNLGLFKVPMPSGLVYRVLPMFRAYARFGIIVILCVSVLAAFGLRAALGRLRTKKAKLFFTSAVLLGIMFEFTNVPPFRVTDITGVPAVYAWLKEQPAATLVAEYPMTRGGGGEAFTNQNYLFYQTKHGRRLVNGAAPGTPAGRVKEKILIVDDPRTPAVLAALGTRYVLLHRDTYERNGSAETVAVAGQIPDLTRVPGYAFIRRIDDVDIYGVTAAAAPWTEVLGPLATSEVP